MKNKLNEMADSFFDNYIKGKTVTKWHKKYTKGLLLLYTDVKCLLRGDGAMYSTDNRLTTKSKDEISKIKKLFDLMLKKKIRNTYGCR